MTIYEYCLPHSFPIPPPQSMCNIIIYNFFSYPEFAKEEQRSTSDYFRARGKFKEYLQFIVRGR